MTKTLYEIRTIYSGKHIIDKSPHDMTTEWIQVQTYFSKYRYNVQNPSKIQQYYTPKEKVFIRSKAIVTYRTILDAEVLE